MRMQMLDRIRQVGGPLERSLRSTRFVAIDVVGWGQGAVGGQDEVGGTCRQDK